MPLLVAPTALRELLAAPPQRLEVRATQSALVLRASVAQHGGAIASYSMADGAVSGRIVFANKSEAVQPDPPDPDALRELWNRTRWATDLVMRTTIGADYLPSEREARIARLFDALERGETTFKGVDPLVDAFSIGDWGAVMAHVERGEWPTWFEPLALAFTGTMSRIRSHADAAPPLLGHLATFRGLARRELHLLDAAFSDLRAGIRNLPRQQRATHYTMIAEISYLLGDPERAVELLGWALPLSTDDESFVRSANQLLRFGGYAVAESCLKDWTDSRDADAAVWLLRARLAIWCGRTGEARLCAEKGSAGDSVERTLILAVADALDGNDDKALAGFASIEHTGIREAYAWSAELLKRRGDSKRAVEHLEIACLTSQNPVHTLLRCVVYEEMQASGRAQLEAQEGIADPEAQTIEAAAAALRTFQGNRGPTPSRTPTTDPATTADALVRVPTPPGDIMHMSRNAAADLLKGLRTQPAQEVHEAFARLQAQYPESAHPYCYWGELLLWEGRFDDAFEAFNANNGARMARWGFVGRAAVQVHRGEFEAAIDEFRVMGTNYAPVRGATTHVYLGELFRVRGEHERALHELDIAIGAKPERIGAQINRVLCWTALGDTERAASSFLAMTNRWPNLFWHALRQVGCTWEAREDAFVETCQAALGLMRGNRSSHLHTFFDRDDEMRFTVDAEGWATHFERCKSHLRLGALEELLVGAD